MASVRMDCVVDPREKQKSIVEGRSPFLRWCVGIAGSFWRWKLLSTSQFAIIWLLREIRAVDERGPCHHNWYALWSPISRELFVSLRVGRIAASGSACPGEWKLKRVKDFWLCDEVIVVPKKESWAEKTVVALKPDVGRTYVTHLGLVGEGVKVSNLGREGGFLCLSYHGS